MSINIVGQTPNISLSDINSGKYSAKGIGSWVSSADGKQFYKLNKDRTKVEVFDFKTGNKLDSFFDIQTARNCNLESIDNFLISPDGKKAILFTETESKYRRSSESVLYYYDLNRNYVEKLTDNSSKQSCPKFSHNSSMLVYSADNNLWLAKFDFSTESQITEDGKLNSIINGTTDWVYEEEFGTTNIIDFSGDDSLIAFVSFDESDVNKYPLQYFDNLYTNIYEYKYPKTGDKNSKVKCNIFDINSKKLRSVALPNTIEYIPKIDFLPESDDLAIFTLNRNQNISKIFLVNGKSLVPKELITETNEKYINSELFANSLYTNDQVVLLSEQDGFQHVFSYNKNGVLNKQLTKGQFDVRKILGMNEQSGDVFFTASMVSPLETEVYKVNIKTGNTTKLSTKAGSNKATLSNNGEFMINNYSDSTTPNSFDVVELSKGKTLYNLQNNEPLSNLLNNSNLPTKEFVTFDAADRTTKLNGYIMKPSNFDSGKKYPVVMIQYSGPDSQQVLNSYGTDWTSYLANQGFIVVCVDGRGTGGRGEDFRKSTYMNLGILESDDQVAVANQLKRMNYIDGNRIGIWGWSYGGYNTIMSMERGNGTFKAGVAIAPVTDWKFYDTVYGERFMRTPQENPKGYQASSTLSHINDLQGQLLIIHGSADDNVHLQNTMEYVKTAIDAQKDIDLFIFPDKDHSILGLKNRNFLFNKVTNFFKDNL